MDNLRLPLQEQESLGCVPSCQLGVPSRSLRPLQPESILPSRRQAQSISGMAPAGNLGHTCSSIRPVPTPKILGGGHLTVASHCHIAAAQGARSGLSEAEHYRRVAARPSSPCPLPPNTPERTLPEQPSPVALLAALAVGLAAFQGNPAQAMLAPSSLLNLPFETTARSPSAMLSSPGTGPKPCACPSARLGWQDLRANQRPPGWGLCQSRIGPVPPLFSLALSLSLPEPGPPCPSKTLILIPNGSRCSLTP